MTADALDRSRAEASAEILDRAGYGDDPDELLRALGDSDLSVRSEAAFLLGYKRQGDAEPHLRSLLEDASARVRVEAALALARLGHEDTAVPILRMELGGEFFQDAPLRAARALALLGDAGGYPRVMEALASPFPSNRMEAVAALASFLPLTGNTMGAFTVDPVGALIGRMSDDEELIRLDALSTLAELSDPRIEQALIGCLEDSSQRVKDLAEELLASR